MVDSLMQQRHRTVGYGDTYIFRNSTVGQAVATTAKVHPQ